MSKDFTEVTGEQSQGPLSTLKNTVFKKIITHVQPLQLTLEHK